MAEYSYDPNWKLRVVVDNTLKPGQQIAQALHAAIEFVNSHPQIQSRWYELSNSVVVMSATPQQLKELLVRCNKKKVQYATFKEPDMNMQMTAVCVEPTRDGKRVTSNFRLALRDL